MSIQYVRDTYKMPWLKRGARVQIRGGVSGRVTSATRYVWVRHAGSTHSRPYHPGDVLPVQGAAPKEADRG